MTKGDKEIAMKIKLHSSELNRMMKTMMQCIDSRDPNLGNIAVIYDNNLLTIRGTNGHYAAVMSTPLLGGDGEVFHVDGTLFAKVCAMCNGDIEISTDGKVCTIKGAGRTRLPIIDANIPAYSPVQGSVCEICAEDISRGYSSVSYAVSGDTSRLVLTGILLETGNEGAVMVTLDGFKMAIEHIDSENHDEMKTVIPGSFMKLVSTSTFSGDVVKIITDGKRIEARTDGMMISCTLLSGDFPPYAAIFPKDFKTETLVNADNLMNALKSSGAVNAMNNLVKLHVEADKITVMSNSEHADFDAEVPCNTHGDSLTIAFNHKFLMETINSVNAEDIVVKFNTPLSPAVAEAANENSGSRLILPVRVQGV